ncbi:TonB-dependent receptor [Sandaracinobacteroides saxicola]|uniref:TonB-dependent receptor n=1 Tax=Sandaracinobacteroides saxicola TaxID=2759707 RepID=A0A7G5IK30_9SPHN|nr:TonB-dependent receptor [Sandaracinobacteroides saxicola]QMW23722.1 TonB-dependent receptor [Sandaracinobacteroides saxicola]
MTLFRTALLASATLAGLAAAPALAQTAAPAAPAANADQGLEDILVTARRRVESIQDTPVAVSAISPATLANAAAPDIRDLVGRTPNLVIDAVNAGPSAAAIAIRGISFEDIEKSFDPAVGVLIDGVYLGTNTGQLLDFFDFQKIEVLRGPQGTLFGRNTTAGVINIERTKPTGVLGAKIQGTVGNYGRRDLRTVINLPKIGDALSLKGFWLHNESGDFYNNVTLGKDYGGRRYDNYGLTARLELGDFDATVTYERVNENTEIDQSATSRTGVDLICLQVPVPGVGLIRPTGIPNAQCDRNTGDDLYTTFSNVPGFARNDGDNVTINANYKLGSVTLTSVTGWRSSVETVRQDFDSTSINFFDTRREQTYRQFSQELRASGEVGEAINYVVGGYYFNSNYTLDQTTFFGPFLQAAAGLPAQGGNRVNHTGKSAALFADVVVKLAEGLNLTVGGRYTWDTKRISNDIFKTGIPALIATPSAKWKQFTPKASLDYKFSDDVLGYASYSRGYRAGGFNGRAQTLSSANTPYNPEKVDSYELGLKTEFLEDRVTLNIAGFYTKYKDKQEEVVRAAPPPAGQETIVSNAASATIKGLEAEFRARATDELTLNGSLGLLDAKYDSFPTLIGAAIVDVSGRKLRRTPDVSASFGFDYVLPVGPGDLMLAASYRYVSSYQTTIVGAFGNPQANDPRGLAGARNVVDASLGYRFDVGGTKIRMSVFGRNLTDDRGLNSTLPVAGLFTFSAARPPRTYGAELGVEF